MAKIVNTKYTYEPYDVSNGYLTEDILEQIWKDILGTANPNVVGLPERDDSQPLVPYYDGENTPINKNFYLSDAFEGQWRSIVNAINKVYNEADSAKKVAEEAKDAIFNTLGNAKAAEESTFNKLSTIMGQANIITGLLDYYSSGLGFNAGNFKGLYKNYTQQELDNGEIDLIPGGTELNQGDIIKDENGNYYTIAEKFTVNDGIKQTILELQNDNKIDGMKVANQGDVNKYNILYKGIYDGSFKEYKKNDLIYYPQDDLEIEGFYLVMEDAISTPDFTDFLIHVKVLGSGNNGGGTTPTPTPGIPNIEYEDLGEIN